MPSDAQNSDSFHELNMILENTTLFLPQTPTFQRASDTEREREREKAGVNKFLAVDIHYF